MAESSLSPSFAKAAALVAVWLPGIAVGVARLNGAASTWLILVVLGLCGLASVALLVLFRLPDGSAPPRATPGGGDQPRVNPAGPDLRAILDSLDEPVLTTDAAGAIVVANRAAGAFFNRSPGQMAGLVIEDLFSQAELLGLHAGALGGAVRRAQIRIPRAGGVRVFQVLAAPVSLAAADGGERPGVVLTLRDVTELAVAVQLKTDFVANASHELRTPLASIRGAVDTLGDAAGDDPAMIRRLGQMIASNVGRLEELTRDLLDLSRLESPEARVEKGPVRASEIAESLAGVFEQQLTERRVGLRFELVPEVEHLDTDPRLLTLILKNLIENSAKFAYEDTTVRVVGSVLPVPEGSGLRPGLCLRVIDQGIGIPLSHQARIFERFYQSDPSRSGQPSQAGRRGTGLGLAIVKHAVKNLGGTVLVSSVWKEGTTMTVELPECVVAHTST